MGAFVFTVLLCVGLGFLFWASASVRSGVYVRLQLRGSKQGRVLYLTFDDGPDGAMTPRVLAILGEQGVPATFFVIGERVQRHPELVRAMGVGGHSVGLHGWYHAWWAPFRGSDFLGAAIRREQDLLEEVLGYRPQMFRPPYGVTNPLVGRAIRSTGVRGVGWSIRSYDTVRRTPRDRVVRRVVRRFHPGAIILLHDRVVGCDGVVRRIVEEGRRQGYTFCALPVEDTEA